MFLFITFIFLTDSRNAILGLINIFSNCFGFSKLILVFTYFIFRFFIIRINCFPIFPNEIKLFMESIIPKRIYTLFPEVGFNNISSYPRINKWISSLNLY